MAWLMLSVLHWATVKSQWNSLQWEKVFLSPIAPSLSVQSEKVQVLLGGLLLCSGFSAQDLILMWSEPNIVVYIIIEYILSLKYIYIIIETFPNPSSPKKKSIWESVKQAFWFMSVLKHLLAPFYTSWWDQYWWYQYTAEINIDLINVLFSLFCSQLKVSSHLLQFFHTLNCSSGTTVPHSIHLL